MEIYMNEEAFRWPKSPTTSDKADSNTFETIQIFSFRMKCELRFQSETQRKRERKISNDSHSLNISKCDEQWMDENEPTW